jgi:hypothetical protein
LLIGWPHPFAWGFFLWFILTLVSFLEEGTGVVTDGLIQFWRIVDWIYYHISRLQYVDKEHANLFRVAIKRYRGEPLQTSDGVTLLPGDRYAKIHIHNWRLAQFLQQERMRVSRHNRSALRMELKVVNAIRRSLPGLVAFFDRHDDVANVKVLAGTTFLYRGAERLHFDIHDYSHPVKRWFKTFFLKVILLVCQPSEWKQLRERRDLIPKRVFISREQLERHYRERMER